MADHETFRALPPHWADDRLSDFIGQAFSNTLATFVNKKLQCQILVRIDGAFFTACQNLLNPQDWIGALLILRAHAGFRAACQLAMNGHITESFPVLRACLEYSLYALHINRNPELGEVWFGRHEDEESLKAIKQEFTIRNVKDTLRNTDEKLSQIVDELYERTIDFGAHPNERAITQSMTINRGDGRIEIQQIYLHGNSLALDHGMKTTAQIGLGSLCIFQNIFRERFDILGISAAIDELRRNL